MHVCVHYTLVYVIIISTLQSTLNLYTHHNTTPRQECEQCVCVCVCRLFDVLGGVYKWKIYDISLVCTRLRSWWFCGCVDGGSRKQCALSAFRKWNKCLGIKCRDGQGTWQQRHTSRCGSMWVSHPYSNQFGFGTGISAKTCLKYYTRFVNEIHSVCDYIWARIVI